MEKSPHREMTARLEYNFHNPENPTKYLSEDYFIDMNFSIMCISNCANKKIVIRTFYDTPLEEARLIILDIEEKTYWSIFDLMNGHNMDMIDGKKFCHYPL